MTETHKLNDGQGPIEEQIDAIILAHGLGEALEAKSAILKRIGNLEAKLAQEREAREKAEAGAAAAAAAMRDALLRLAEDAEILDNIGVRLIAERAISSDVGRALLERVERLEKFVKEFLAGGPYTDSECLTCAFYCNADESEKDPRKHDKSCMWHKAEQALRGGKPDAR